MLPIASPNVLRSLMGRSAFPISPLIVVMIIAAAAEGTQSLPGMRAFCCKIPNYIVLLLNLTAHAGGFVFLKLVLEGIKK